ncbi:unnamed protein product [Merluccius merluccius]
MLKILSTVVEEPILKDIRASVAIGLEVDEKTDVSVKKQLDVHDMDQQHLMESEVGEWGQLFPLLSKLAAIGLTVPVSSVNCERDFSTMNRVGYLAK